MQITHIAARKPERAEQKASLASCLDVKLQEGRVWEHEQLNAGECMRKFMKSLWIKSQFCLPQPLLHTFIVACCYIPLSQVPGKGMHNKKACRRGACGKPGECVQDYSAEWPPKPSQTQCS